MLCIECNRSVLCESALHYGAFRDCLKQRIHATYPLTLLLRLLYISREACMTRNNCVFCEEVYVEFH